MALAEFLSELGAHLAARYPLLLIVTNEEERLERLAAKAAGGAGFSLVRWNQAAGFRALGGGAAVAGAEKIHDASAALGHILQGPDKTLYLLEDFHRFWSEPGVVRQLKEALRELRRKAVTLACVGPAAQLPAELEKEAAVRELPLPTPAELLVELQGAANSFPEGKRPSLPEDLAKKMANAAAGLTEGEARRLFAKALLLRSRFAAADVPLLLAEKKQIIRQSETLEFFEAAEGLGAIGGLEELKAWLQSREKAFGEEARAFGLPQPKGLLLLGVQGCGKSLTAKAVANLWRLPLLRLDFGAVFSSQSAGPEENLRRALRVAESVAPAVLWVDEVEKGLAGAASDTAGTSARVLGSFLTWMQEKKQPVFVVATANSVAQLPPELLRKGRFDEIFFVDLPDVHERKKIFEIHITRRGRDPAGFGCQELAQAAEKFSGAEIEESIVSAMHEAFAAGREVTGQDVRSVVKETVPLAVTQEEQIQALKDWARNRARRASLDTRMLDVFGEGARRGK